MASEETKESDEIVEETQFRPKLFEVDPGLDAIFLFCTEQHIAHIHQTVMMKEYKKYWESVPVAIVFVMTSSLTSDMLNQFCDVITVLQENLIAIYIKMWFDLFMHHIEYHEVEAFTNAIFNCIESHSLWRLRLILKYKHCHSDLKWHELMHQLITSSMMLQLTPTNTFRRAPTLRLHLRITDYILYWKLHHDKYTEFINHLRQSTSLGHLKMEFGSLYKVHTNYSYLVSNLFQAITENTSISGIGLASCAEDSDISSSSGITQMEEDLASLLSNTYDHSERTDHDDEDANYLSYIYKCFETKKIDARYSGNSACWKQQSYKFSSSHKDFLLQIHSKYNIKHVLNAMKQNKDLCLNCLVLENVIYDHEENEQNWDDPFDNNESQRVVVDPHNVWKELLDVCTSDEHFIEILEFEESKIGKMYCDDLQLFFNTIIFGNKFNKENKQCHMKKLVMKSISQHATDVFIQYMADLMKYGLSYNPMLAEINVEFDYIGNLKIFKAKITTLIDAALFRITAMIESQFAIEEYLHDEMGIAFGVIQLVLQLSRFSKIKFQINEEDNELYAGNTTQKVAFAQMYIKAKMSEALKRFEERYDERKINKYLMWQYKDNLDDDKRTQYTPVVDADATNQSDELYCDLMAKYMKFICAGDVRLEIGYTFHY
eukprot:314158_1